jgi:peroxiredoxin Q/BCP
MLKIGSTAPSFSLAADSGASVSLESLRGRTVVLFFYPRDDTPGCTTEVCEFRDRWQAVKRAGAVVLGVSPDDLRSHRRFRDKFSLPFPLLIDADHAVAEAYGVWGEKSLFGHRYQGIRRTTFVINAGGRIAQIFERVKPRGHAAQVLEALSG